MSNGMDWLSQIQRLIRFDIYLEKLHCFHFYFIFLLCNCKTLSHSHPSNHQILQDCLLQNLVLLICHFIFIGMLLISPEISVFHYPHNIRSKRVIEKCGFKYEVTIKHGNKIYDGQIFDTVCYSILKSEYYNKSIDMLESALILI